MQKQTFLRLPGGRIVNPLAIDMITAESTTFLLGGDQEAVQTTFIFKLRGGDGFRITFGGAERDKALALGEGLKKYIQIEGVYDESI